MKDGFVISALVVIAVAWVCHLLGVPWLLAIILGILVCPILIAWRNNAGGGGPPTPLSP